MKIDEFSDRKILLLMYKLEEWLLRAGNSERRGGGQDKRNGHQNEDIPRSR